MPNVPGYVTMVFLLTTFITWLGAAVILYQTQQKREPRLTHYYISLFTGGVVLWLSVHGVLAYIGFYRNFEAMPPRPMLVMAPVILFALIMPFRLPRFSFWLEAIPLGTVTYFHIIRIPIELVLFWLAHAQVIPSMMTFEGTNFDIISGLTAPFIAYFCFTRPQFSPRLALWWNFLALGLLLNIVITAMLAAPTPLQQIAFDQPNLLIVYFPFIWLAIFIVPMVYLAHLVAIKRLWR